MCRHWSSVFVKIGGRVVSDAPQRVRVCYYASTSDEMPDLTRRDFHDVGKEARGSLLTHWASCRNYSAMSSAIYQYALWLALLVTGLPVTFGQSSAPISAPQPYDLEPQPGVLLLRNGSTLQGFVAPAGDRYLVLFGDTGEARVPAVEVVAVCRDLEEAYGAKRLAIDNSLKSRLDLAHWCLQQNLVARAADQLLAAEVQHGSRPQLQAFHQRLIRLASTSSPTSTASRQSATAITPASFESAATELPVGATESFAAAVQPLLLNRCATGGCHGPHREQGFTLLKPPVGRGVTKRLTEQNLRAVMAQINRTAPLQSPLLNQAITAHGGSEQAAILEREAKQYEALSAWVKNVTQHRRAAEPPTIAQPPDVLFQSRVGGANESPPPATNSAASNASEVAPVEIGSDAIDSPSDPFDPAIFNRQRRVAVP